MGISKLFSKLKRKTVSKKNAVPQLLYQPQQSQQPHQPHQPPKPRQPSNSTVCATYAKNIILRYPLATEVMLERAVSTIPKEYRQCVLELAQQPTFQHQVRLNREKTLLGSQNKGKIRNLAKIRKNMKMASLAQARRIFDREAVTNKRAREALEDHTAQYIATQPMTRPAWDPHVLPALKTKENVRYAMDLKRQRRATYLANQIRQGIRGGHGEKTPISNLIRNGANIHALSSNGTSLLHDAASHGNIEALKRLYAAGVPLNTPNKSGSTALHLAAARGDHGMTRTLLGLGANVHVRNAKGQTALHIAGSLGHDVLPYVRAGAKVNARDRRQRTAMHQAASRGNAAAIQRLLDSGAHINAQEVGGMTPMHIAASRGHGNVVNLLKRRGAKIDVRDRLGKTPLRYAENKGHRSIANTLAPQTHAWKNSVPLTYLQKLHKRLAPTLLG